MEKIIAELACQTSESGTSGCGLLIHYSIANTFAATDAGFVNIAANGTTGFGLFDSSQETKTQP
jgi:hypothetical protein